jgi:signal transduction histidine kinase/CheY-like chemotaxis protein
VPQTKQTLASKLHKFTDGNHARSLTAGMLVTFACIALIGWNIWRSYQTVERVHDQQLKLQALVASNARLDDGLTAYVRLAAITGDSRWEQLYQESETKIRESAADVIQLAEERENIDPKNTSLPLRTATPIEQSALTLAREGKLEQASELVMGGAYQVERSRYTAAIAALTNAIEDQLDRDLDLSKARLQTAVVLAAVASGVLLVVWISLIGAIRRNLELHAATVSERKALDDQIQYAQRLESLSVLAGGIAHDFNNLLTGILSNAGTARRKLASSDTAQHHLSEIIQGSKLAAHLTGQLLAYAGKGQFHIVARDLTAEVLEIRELLESSVRRRAKLEFHLADNLPAILVDPTQIQQVLMNIIINASESVDGNVSVRIDTHVLDVKERDLRELVHGSPLAPGRCVAVDVTDTGSGMTPETLERIFDPFFTTKTSGRGLGLAATVGIVHRHGGGIRVDSRPGKGTSFRVIFPASDQRVRPPEERPVTDLSGYGVVLVVDDDNYILQAVYVALESYGYSVLLANSGAVAIELFEEHRDQIDLVLLDMLMPGMSGEETFRALRLIRPDVKVLLSTGYAPDEATQRFTEEGLAGFLRKPYDPDELAGEVQRIIERGSAMPSEQMQDALTDLRASYRAKLPEQLEELLERLRASRQPDGGAALQQARDIAHRLAGTTGSYGLSEIHSPLEKIDVALLSMIDDDADAGRWEEIDAAVALLSKHLPPATGA